MRWCFFAGVLAGIVSFISCEPETGHILIDTGQDEIAHETPAVDDPPVSYVAPDGFEVTPFSHDPLWAFAKGGTDSISVSSLEPWNVSYDSEWLSLSSSEGGSGVSVVRITTRPNTGESARNAKLLFSVGDGRLEYELTQFPDIFKRHAHILLKVHSSLVIRYDSTRFSRIYSVIPVPHTDQYQTVTKVGLFAGAFPGLCADGHNMYAVSDISGDIPKSGREVNSCVFDAELNMVETDFQRIGKIQAYDTEAPEYLRYTSRDSCDGRVIVDPLNQDILRLSDELWMRSEMNILSYARMCYEWTARNLTYGDAFTGLHPVEEIMRSRRGDCGAFTSVYVSLLRAKGIPARHLLMISPLDGYHIRAEFYLSGYGWIPVDPTFKNSNPSRDYFGNNSGRHIVVSHGICTEVEGPFGPCVIDGLQQYYWWAWRSEGDRSYDVQHQVSLLGMEGPA